MDTNSLFDFRENGSCPFHEVHWTSSACTIEMYCPENFSGEYSDGNFCREGFSENCPRFIKFFNQLREASMEIEKVLQAHPNKEFDRYGCPYLKKSGFLNVTYTCLAQNCKIENPIRLNLLCLAFYTELFDWLRTGRKNPGCSNAFTLCEYFSYAREHGDKFPGELSKCEYFDMLDKTCLLRDETHLSIDKINKNCCCINDGGEGKRKCNTYTDKIAGKGKKRHNTFERVLESMPSKMEDITEKMKEKYK